TANLMAPVVINQKTREAKQVVLDKSHYTTKHRLFSPKEDI
ncbi:MAG: flagellar assembly protein FliW, partial [Schwartzia sp. (in: firmicutes)]